MTAAGIALANAALMITTGDPIRAEKAFALRLVSEVVPRESCLRGRARSPIK